VSDVPIKEGNLLSWVNNEAQRLLRQLRSGANSVLTERTECATLGAGAFVRLWESAALPTAAAWGVRTTVTGVSTSGAAQRADYELAASFESTAGTVAQVGTTTTVHSAESTAAINARFGATARTIYVEVRDDATSPMHWVAHTRVNGR
jgi:hypothetical protein